jgi:hypothetical protein
MRFQFEREQPDVAILELDMQSFEQRVTFGRLKSNWS